MRPIIQLAAVLTALLGLAACAAPNALPPVNPADTAVADEDDLSQYKIGPGDDLEVFVWRNPEISTTVPVRPDGKISTPLVEDMVAVGKTPSELARDIEEVLKVYIKQPQVNVIVTNFQGVYEGQVRVVGQAANPQAIPYREGMTVLDVMIAVGGLGEFAAGNRAKLVRAVDGETIEYRLKLNDLMNRGRIDQNVAIRPGDVIIIPEALF